MNDNDNELMTESPVTFRVEVVVDTGDGEEHRVNLMNTQTIPFDVMLEIKNEAMHGDLDVAGIRNDTLTFGALVATTFFAEHAE